MSEKRDLLSLEEFLTFSARLNYLLAAREPSYEMLAAKIADGFMMTTGSSRQLRDGVAYLVYAYRNRSRRLGPSAVLHPLRAAHLLVLATEGTSIVNMLAAFLHDYLEDIYTPDLSGEKRQDLQSRYLTLQEELTPRERQEMNQMIDWLTRRSSEEYHEYLGRLVDEGAKNPNLLWVKLSDRLDNTYDLRIFDDIPSDPFRSIFDILFVNRHNDGPPPAPDKPISTQMDEAHRLYQLFKNAIFLTLVRRSRLDEKHLTTHRLFAALAEASLNEAGRILNQLLGHSVTDPQRQRFLVMDAMQYCQEGGIERLTPAQRGHKLDGLFKSRFDHTDRKVRKQKLKLLQEDKEFMVSIAVTFLVIFEKYIGSPNYQLGGVRASGLTVEDTLI